MLTNPATMMSTGHVSSKRYGVKLFSANNTPTVITITGPRRPRMPERSLSLMARLARRLVRTGAVTGKDPPQQVNAQCYEKYRPVTRHPVEIEQLERVQEQQSAQHHQRYSGNRRLIA